MAMVFEKVLRDAERKVGTSDYSDELLRDFLRDKAMQATSRNVNPNRIINRKKAEVVNVIQPGDLLFYNYSPKYKDKLDYYDAWPMIFPIEVYQDGFLAINIHYLPPIFRARLMDKLYDLITNEKYDQTTRLRISYDILNASAKFRYFRPCIKRYLSGHVKSKIIKIDPKEWSYATMLPTARWQKASARRVWNDSLKIISGRK